MADLVDKGLAPSSVRLAYQMLSKPLAAAVEAGLLLRSPCKGISLPKIEVKEMPVLNAAQALHLADSIDPRYRALVLLAAYSSMRWGELIALKPNCLDTESRTVDVAQNIVEVSGKIQPPSPPKTRAGRRKVPLPRSIMEELVLHVDSLRLSDTDLLFQAPDGGTLRTTFRNRFWHPATKKAGIFPFRFHDLRHTAISYWIFSGASPKEVAKWAGHTSVSVVLDRYGHLFPESGEKPMAALDTMFKEAKEKKEREA